jgi:hypothetical protein
MQFWFAPGHGPSQFGNSDCSQAIGSQMQRVDPVVGSGTQTVPVGHSPSQVGHGDWSQAMRGSQRQASWLGR